MHADPQKLELRNDSLPRLPGPGGIGGIGSLGALGGPLPPTHDLTRPGSLFAAASMCISFEHLCFPTETPYPHSNKRIYPILHLRLLLQLVITKIQTVDLALHNT